MLDKENLIYILDKLFDQSKKYYDDFNSADAKIGDGDLGITCLLYTSPSPRDRTRSRMPSSA